MLGNRSSEVPAPRPMGKNEAPNSDFGFKWGPVVQDQREHCGQARGLIASGVLRLRPYRSDKIRVLIGLELA